MKVDEAWGNDQACGVDLRRPLRRCQASPDLDRRDQPFRDEDVADGVQALGRVDNPAATNEDVALHVFTTSTHS